MKKPSLALSSCWNSFRHNDGYLMLREIADLGFTHAELSHGIRIVLVPGILRAVEEGFIQISSTHNFCPLPTGITQAVPNLFEPSCRDQREHEQWLRHTRRSLDFAAQVKASTCVLHLGSARFWFFPPSRGLRSYLEQNKLASPPTDEKYLQLLHKAGEKMRKKMGPFFDQTLASLREINAHAKERGVRLGCENREKFEELPLDDDFPKLFEALGPDTACGYWHDTGHAEIKVGLGLINHREQIARNADRLLGFHLHDVNSAGKDHQGIGSGSVDFDMISHFWKPHHLLTLELSPRIPISEVLESRRRVQELIAKRFGY